MTRNMFYFASWRLSEEKSEVKEFIPRKGAKYAKFGDSYE
jgi:hypothetical protein